MQPQPKKPSKLQTPTKNAAPKILALFPNLCFWKATNQPQKKNAQQQLVCLRVLGKKAALSVSEVSQATKLPRADAQKQLKKLTAEGLVTAEKKTRSSLYQPSTLGWVALLAFKEFQSFEKLKIVLTAPEKKNEALAYSLLVMGHCTNTPDGVYQACTKYAAQAHIMEGTSPQAIAESLLAFYRQELRTNSPAPPAYLSVFKEFTTTGFQDVFRMLLMAIKPTAEDYNWLIEFFNEVAEFYFDPSRVAYVNLLAQNSNLASRLADFKKSQDQQIKKEGKNLEVTFTIPNSGISKIDAMPPHLRAVGMRLILEPAKFINKELQNHFWPT
jgi:DNA-binding transcriptional ArsR family regulator